MNDYSNQSSAPDQSSVSPLALLAAGGAALVGALLWAAIGYVTGYEVGYVAWAIGGMVGFATVLCGGRGMTVATVASFITILGIFTGKIVSTHFLVQDELSGAWEETFTTQLYEELKVDAVDFAALGGNPSDEALWEFMVDHEYAEDTGRVDPAGIAWFNNYNRAPLIEFQQSVPGYSEWREQSTADARAAFAAEFSIAQAVIDDLNPIDLLFTFLAVSTAFGMIRRASPTSPTSAEPQLLATSDDTRRVA